jgi:hypothetical protein
MEVFIHILEHTCLLNSKLLRLQILNVIQTDSSNADINIFFPKKLQILSGAYLIFG